MSLRKFPQLSDYIAHVQSKFPITKIPLKIMGSYKAGKFYYSASLITYAHNEVKDPDTQSVPVDAFFGEIYNYGCKLDSNFVYSTITAGEDGKISPLQGDVIELNSKVLDIEFHHALILSHSCGVNYLRLTLCPVLKESELNKDTLEKLKGSPVKNPQQIANNWLWNENLNYLGLPMRNDEGEDIGDRLLVCLSLPFNIDKNEVFKSNLKYRLSYKGLSYLQMRLGLQYFRDVQHSDDCRDM